MRVQAVCSADSVFSLKYHLVWCPKSRRPALIGDVAERLNTLLCKKAAQVKATLQVLRVMPDHVTLFIETHPTCSPAHLARWLKGHPSHTLRAGFRHLRDRLPALWYYIGTLGHVPAQTIRRYIEAQRGV